MSFTSRRLGGDGSSRDSSDDYSEINRSISSLNPAAQKAQNLILEIRQAVNEAQPKGKVLLSNIVSKHDSMCHNFLSCKH